MSESVSLPALGESVTEGTVTRWLKKVGDTWNSPANRASVWRSRAKVTPDLLVKLINDKSTTEADKQRYLRAFDFLTGPEKDSALLKLLTAAN
jgi:hypothetical protein